MTKIDAEQTELPTLPFVSLNQSGPSGAEFSQCGLYRFGLWRFWDNGGRVAAFIGLNPSTADHVKTDPTVRRCIAFAKRWGCGGMFMLNAYAFRSTDPKGLKTIAEPVGRPRNDLAIVEYAAKADIVVACWGMNCSPVREREVFDLVKPLQCFGITSRGSPRHPLYLRSMRALEPFDLPRLGKP